MGHLIDDLLHMAQIGRKEVIRRPVDAHELVQSVIRDLQPECEGRQIQWQLGDLPTLECDQGLMKLPKKCFTNLLSNAVKYSRRSEQAVIEVGQTMEDGVPVIFVRDNGAGFGPAICTPPVRSLSATPSRRRVRRNRCGSGNRATHNPETRRANLG